MKTSTEEFSLLKLSAKSSPSTREPPSKNVSSVKTRLKNHDRLKESVDEFRSLIINDRDEIDEVLHKGALGKVIFYKCCIDDP